MADSKTPPKYNVAIVESVVLETAAELHPTHLAVNDLALRIVSNSEDSREVETATQAIQGLREFDLLKDRDDEIVEPTQAALRACALLI
jgi:hypothetical protein